LREGGYKNQRSSSSDRYHLHQQMPSHHHRQTAIFTPQPSCASRAIQTHLTVELTRTIKAILAVLAFGSQYFIFFVCTEKQ